MLGKVYTFQNTTYAIEEIVDAKGDQGRCLILIDNDTGEVYRYPVNLETAKQLGAAMMGLGKVELANGSVDLDRVAQEAASRKGRPGQ